MTDVQTFECPIWALEFQGDLSRYVCTHSLQGNVQMDFWWLSQESNSIYKERKIKITYCSPPYLEHSICDCRFDISGGVKENRFVFFSICKIIVFDFIQINKYSNNLNKCLEYHFSHIKVTSPFLYFFCQMRLQSIILWDIL